MKMYGLLANQDKTEGVPMILLSCNVEEDAEKRGLTLDDYIEEFLKLNPQYERVYCR